MPLQIRYRLMCLSFFAVTLGCNAAEKIQEEGPSNEVIQAPEAASPGTTQEIDGSNTEVSKTPSAEVKLEPEEKLLFVIQRSYLSISN